MIVHFVCTGNTYRSRMAEAYFNSKLLEDARAFSSGITASKNHDGPITWYAEKIIKENGLVPYMSFRWQQTDLDLLEKSDLVIFMTKRHIDYVKKELKFESDNFEVWHIADLNQFDYEVDDPQQKLLNEVRITKNTFVKIKKKTDKLIERL